MDERQFVAAVTPSLRDMAYVSLALIDPADADAAAQEALATPLGGRHVGVLRETPNRRKSSGL